MDLLAILPHLVLLLLLTTAITTAHPTTHSPTPPLCSSSGETHSPNPHNNLLSRNNTIAAYRRIWVNCLRGPWGLSPNHQMMFCGFRRSQIQDGYYWLKPALCTTLCSCSCSYTPSCEQLHNCSGYMVMLACFDRSRVNTAGCYCDDGTYPFWKRGEIEGGELGMVERAEGSEVKDKGQGEAGLAGVPVSGMSDPPKMTAVEGGGSEMKVADEGLAPTLVQKAEARITEGWPIPRYGAWC